MTILIRFLIKTISIIISATILLAYLSPYIYPKPYWQFSLLGLGLPWLLLSVFLLLLLNGAMRHYAVMLWLVAVLLLGLPQISAIMQPPKFAATTTHKAIKVLNYNIFGLSVLKFNNLTEADFIKFVGEQNADIACFQEIHNAFDFQTKIKKAGHFPYMFEQGQLRAIYSKFPIIGGGVIDSLCFPEYGKIRLKNFKATGNGCTYADVLIQNDTVRVYNLQLQSNQISTTANNLRYNGGVKKLKRRQGWADIKHMFGLFRHEVQLRAEQADKVHQHILASKRNVIVCGDFNDTPASYTYHAMQQGLQDAFREAGSGLGFTYGGSVPSLRIDYILTSDAFDIQHFYIPKVNFSDHYPVVMSVKLR